MASFETETTIYPLQMDPSTKAIHLSSQEQQQEEDTLSKELKDLNTLHRTLITQGYPNNTPPPPLPVNPKRSAQVTKLRDSASTAYRKNNSAEAIRLYTFAIEMASSRPPWEPVSLVREELGALFANRAQAYMSAQNWPEGLVDARCSLECKDVGNVKAFWRCAKCLVEMGRLQEAREVVLKGLAVEDRVDSRPPSGNAAAGRKELAGLLGDVEAAMRGEVSK